MRLSKMSEDTRRDEVLAAIKLLKDRNRRHPSRNNLFLIALLIDIKQLLKEEKEWRERNE
jgi:hypothetical protein